MYTKDRNLNISLHYSDPVTRGRGGFRGRAGQKGNKQQNKDKQKGDNKGMSRNNCSQLMAQDLINLIVTWVQDVSRVVHKRRPPSIWVATFTHLDGNFFSMTSCNLRIKL